MRRWAVGMFFVGLYVVGSAGYGLAAEPPFDVVQLYDRLAHINGDQEGGAPVICFPTGVSRLAGSAWDPTRLAAIRREVRDFGALLNAAHRVSGRPSGRVRVRITGYADGPGDTAPNATLSYERARAVAQLLQQHVEGVQLSVQIEGRGEAHADGNLSGGCEQPARITTAAALPVPVDANRRVEIEILSPVLTHAQVGRDQALRLFPEGSMPWRPLRVMLMDAPLQLLADEPSASRCYSGSDALNTKAYPATPWVQLSRTASGSAEGRPLDYDDNDVWVRFVAFPVRQSGPSASRQDRLRLVMDLAAAPLQPPSPPPQYRGQPGVPEYWATRLRLPRVVTTFQDKAVADWQRFHNCHDLLARLLSSHDNLRLNLSDRFGTLDTPGPLVDEILASRLPKNMDGLLLHVHRLDRRRGFFDLQPGMSLTLRPTITDALARLTQPAGPAELTTQSDPVDSCEAVPRPRCVPHPQSVSVSDPFLAFLISVPGGAHCKSSAVGCANTAVAQDTDDEPEPMALAAPPPSRRRSLLSSHLSFEYVLQGGVTRIYVPTGPGNIFRRPEYPNNEYSSDYPPRIFGSDGPVGDSRYNSAMTLLISRGSRLELDNFSRESAIRRPDATYPCTDADRCTVALGGWTYSPTISIRVGDRERRVILGSRLVHVLPPDIVEPCFEGIPRPGEWPPRARLRRPVTLGFPSPLASPMLIDRGDCRLLGIPLVQGNSVSW